MQVGRCCKEKAANWGQVHLAYGWLTHWLAGWLVATYRLRAKDSAHCVRGQAATCSDRFGGKEM
jgi:hypothetical protein